MKFCFFWIWNLALHENEMSIIHDKEVGIIFFSTQHSVNGKVELPIFDQGPTYNLYGATISNLV